jgi:hypothetical protein
MPRYAMLTRSYRKTNRIKEFDMTVASRLSRFGMAGVAVLSNTVSLQAGEMSQTIHCFLCAATLFFQVFCLSMVLFFKLQ